MNAIQLTKKACASKFLAAFACVVCLCGSYAAYAAVASSEAAEQASQVVASGVIVDAQGEPIVGASVVEKGTTNGVMADVAGKFSLRVKSGAQLEISCVGYATKVVKADANLKIVLSDDENLLNETVVVGFGTQKKENLTGAVASVNVGKSIEGRTIADVGQGLQGAVAGVNVRLASTEVGSDAMIRIRGQVGSYQGGSSPLILLDNVEIPSLNLVNPEDIESISVLKDAASASIYGAKAAFGVILITSKKSAEQDNVHVTYSGNFSFQNMAKNYQMGGVEALHYAVEALERIGSYDPIGAFTFINRASYNASKEWVKKYANLDPYDPWTFGRDWYASTDGKAMAIRPFDPYTYMVRKNAPTQTHNISVAGNKGRTNFNVSLGYLNQSGMMKTTNHDWYKRYNANARVNTQINNWLAFHAGLMFTRSTKSWAFVTNSTTADPWYYLFRWSPVQPIVPYDENGALLRSPVSESMTANQAKDVTTYTSVNVGTTITPVKGWDIDFDYTYANTNESVQKNGVWYTAANTWGQLNKAVDASGAAIMIANEWADYNQLGSQIQKQYFPVSTYNGAGSSYDLIYQSSYTSQRHTFNATSTYNVDFGKGHNIKAMIGFNGVAYDYTGINAQRKGLMDWHNPQFDLATGTQTNGGTFSWSATAGFFGRLNYNYKERYLLEANIRYDGTSKFPTKLKWQWFPSFSAGWRVSEEPWMQGAKSVLSALKIRASWGSIGDQSVGSSMYIPTMGRSTSNWMNPNGSELLPYYATPAAVATDISWQRIETLDIGLDARFWDALGITFDWYQRDTKDMIVGAEGIGYNIGASAPNGNYGSLRTRGWELSLNYGHIFDNGLYLSATANLSDAKTIITKYGSAKGVSGWYNGKNYGEIWGFRSKGLFQNEDFAHDANGNLILVEANDPSNPKGYAYKHYKFADGSKNALQGKYNYSNYIFGPGDVKYEDLNGDGVIDKGAELIDDHGDLTVIGNTTPRYEYSLRFDLEWKGIDFSILGQGIGKRDMVGYGMMAQQGFYPTNGAMSATIANDFWYEEKDASGKVVASNYNAFYARPSNTGDSSGAFNSLASDRYLLNMAYFRIKNITLGYTLPKNISMKAAMSKARIYFTLENFFTFDHLNGMPFDPEAISGYSYLNTSNYNAGRTGEGTPSFKSYAVGIQITF